VSTADNVGEIGQGDESARGEIVKHPVHLVTEQRKGGGPMGPHSSSNGTAQNTMVISTTADSSKKISMLNDGVA
jgi:hypothetical protein